MNYSTAVFLINPSTRAITATYEAEENASATTFKTLDASIKKDDLIIVPTKTRHKFTVCKVKSVDVDIDFDSSEIIEWVVGRVLTSDHDRLLAMESDAVAKIKSAEVRKKRETLAANLLADAGSFGDDLKALPLANTTAE